MVVLPIFQMKRDVNRIKGYCFNDCGQDTGIFIISPYLKKRKFFFISSFSF